jgi:tRNA A58 N-methylase Trm61
LIKDVILVTDEKGRKYLARLRDEMVLIQNLGTIRADAIRDALGSGELVIGGKKLSIRPATVDDVISVIERKAQMLTAKDIAMMIHLCDVRCGSRVVEGGADQERSQSPCSPASVREDKSPHTRSARTSQR